MKAFWINELKNKLDQRRFAPSKHDKSELLKLLDAQLPVQAAKPTFNWKMFGLGTAAAVVGVLAIGRAVYVVEKPVNEEIIIDNIKVKETTNQTPSELLVGTYDSTESTLSFEGIGNETAKEQESKRSEKGVSDLDNAISVRPDRDLSSETRYKTADVSKNSSQEVNMGFEKEENVTTTLLTESNYSATFDALLKKPLWQSADLMEASQIGLVISNPSLLGRRNKELNALNESGFRLHYWYPAQSSWGIDVRKEWKMGQWHLGIGFGTERAEQAKRQNVTSTDVRYLPEFYWNRFDSWQTRIDSTWVIAGIQQGYWRLDTNAFYGADSLLMVRNDTIIESRNQLTYRKTPYYSLYVPISFDYRFYRNRWAFLVGTGASFHMVRWQQSEINSASETDWQYRLGGRFGFDYAVNAHWSIGAVWQPEIRQVVSSRAEWTWSTHAVVLMWRW